ncbi:ABC transporter ATP-binding protein [Candidatus Latescibacterota bacterium]
MKTAVLQLSDFMKKYDSGGNGFQLKIPSMVFEKGSVYGLVGPNGSGKTTLLDCLSLIEEPSRGNIFFEGKHVVRSNILDIRKRMTMIMEDPYIFSTTVFKNITSGLRCRNINKNTYPQTVKTVLGMVGLEGFENRFAPELSAGERQRVAIARALAIKPEILFLDEPFSNVDRNNITVIENIIRSLKNKDDITIIFSTHDISQAYRLSDHVVSLVDGKIIDSSLENLFKGTVEDDNGSQTAKISDDVSFAVVTDFRGETNICIPPEDILLSFNPIESSARNSFTGIIKKIRIDEQTVKIFTSIGNNVELISLITKKSFETMKLSAGTKIFVIFKTTSVKVF